MYHCLFEQSGTFKNEFIKLGYQAKDYDILNEFGQTDVVVDLFGEIEKGYANKPSIFDQIDSVRDTIIAFFPCTRFQSVIPLKFRGEAYDQKNWDDVKKLEYSMKLHSELHNLYIYISKLCVMCIKRNIKLVIENPYTQPHYLTNYWCLKPKVIDQDRREHGDYFKKPTQYWFINCEPKENFIFEAVTINSLKTTIDSVSRAKGMDKTKANSVKVARSMIHPNYANRFIREFIIDEI